MMPGATGAMLGLMKLAIIVLVALNAALLVAWSGAFGPIVGDAREPHRLAQQVRPEQLRILTAPVTSQAAAVSTESAAVAPSAATPQAAAPAAVGASSASVGASPASVGASPAGAAPTPGSTPAAPAMPAASVPASGQAASPGTAQACIEWGPIAEADLRRASMAAEQVAARVEPLRRTFDVKAFMVHVPSTPDPGAAQARAVQLKQAGIDAYVLPDGPYRGSVSLGVLRQEESARALLRELEHRGVTDARIAPRGTERWVLRLWTTEVLPIGRRDELSARFRRATFSACPA